MSSHPKLKPVKFTIVNPALARPHIASPEDLARLRTRLAACRSCPRGLYEFKAGQHRCLSVDRKCERLDLLRASETCPIGAWKTQAPKSDF